VIPRVEKHFLHGEMVAMGLLTQLVLEGREDETRRVAEFFATVGLPTHLGQLSLAAGDTADLSNAFGVALAVPFLANEPFAVTADSLVAAMRRADVLGKEVCSDKGEAAYRALRV